MDWVGHHLDIAHWGMNCDTTGPTEICEPKATYLDEWPWDCATSYSFKARYRNGIEMTVSSSIPGGTKWIGEEGWVWVNRGAIEAEPKSLLKLEISPSEAGIIRSPNHYRNFLDSVKSRALTITPAETAHRSASVGQLGQIALRLRRDIRWNPDTEEIIDDPEAAACWATRCAHLGACRHGGRQERFGDQMNSDMANTEYGTRNDSVTLRSPIR